METVLQQYHRLRPQITSGCLILISKPAFVSKVIRIADNSEVSHIAISIVMEECNFIIDSNADGVQPHLLSNLIQRQNRVDNISYFFVKANAKSMRNLCIC